MNMTKKFATAFAALALTAGAQAAIVPFTTSTGELPTNTTIEQTFSAAAGDMLTFTLDGYRSLDGQNFYEDDFSVVVNGDPIFKGTFNLGGGGANKVYYGDSSAYTFTSPKTIAFALPVFSDDGIYTVDFTYTSLSKTSGHAGFQGLGDEAWGVSNVAVVPEPSSVALMLAGLGIVGGLARRRAARQA